jgi:hypothetical protein
MPALDPNLTIRPQERKDGSWCVRATRSYVPFTDVGNFKCETDAQDWIIHKAKDHFGKKSDPSSR